MKVPLLLIAVLVAVLGPWMLPRTALACSCAVPQAARQVGYADVVVVGTLVKQVSPQPVNGVMSSAWPIEAIVSVQRYLKGTGSASITFRSPLSGASCGFLEPGDTGHRFLLMLRTEGVGFESDLCAGNARLGEPFFAEYISDVMELTGPGIPPEVEEAAPAANPASDSDEPDGMNWAGLAAIGAATAVVLLAGGWFLRGRRRGSGAGSN